MRKTILAAVIAALLLTTGASCQAAGDGGPMIEQDAPDCDWGDLHEAKPDPDCGGAWFGTPTPAVHKTTAPARTGAPRPRTTRR